MLWQKSRESCILVNSKFTCLWHFHLSQSWYRKIVSIGLGDEYKTEESEIGQWLKWFFSAWAFWPQVRFRMLLRLTSWTTHLMILDVLPSLTSSCRSMQEKRQDSLQKYGLTQRSEISWLKKYDWQNYNAYLCVSVMIKSSNSSSF